jgi:DNA modification methylase
MSGRVIVLRGDAAHLPLPDESVDLIVTSPPYFGQRDYRDGGESLKGQIGGEDTPREYVDALLACTREWVRVLKPEGSLFVNLGDSYYSGKGAPGRTTTDPKNAGRNARRTTRSPLDYGLDLPRKTLIGLPSRYMLGCIDDLGLTVRRDIIWHKVSAQPESVTDRCATRHEYLFHMVMQPRYYTAVDELREPVHADHHTLSRRDRTGRRLAAANAGQTSAVNPLGKLPGSVWEVASQPLSIPGRVAHARCCRGFAKPGCEGLAHHAAFPMELPRRCILGWSPPGICAACGEGRRPVAPAVPREPNDRLSISTRARTSTARGTHVGSTLGYPAVTAERRIIGYACACPDATAPTRPALVVDPFGGTGTTALVASSLGRIGITFDLSSGYCDLATWRTQDPGERARALGVPKPPLVMDGQGDLFDLGEAS